MFLVMIDALWLPSDPPIPGIFGRQACRAKVPALRDKLSHSRFCVLVVDALLPVLSALQSCGLRRTDSKLSVLPDY